MILLTGIVPGLLFGGCTTETPATGCRTVLNCKDDGAPICDPNTLSCRACRPGDDVACSNRNPQTPLCGSFGRCVGCMSNADCRDLRLPRCSTSDSQCVTCQANSDCLSKVCNPDGSCAPSTDVIFVDNKGGTCTGAHTGDMNDPYCAIQEAVSAAVSNDKGLIAVVPSSVPYAPVQITAVGAGGLRLSSTTGAFGSVMVRATNVAAISVALSGSDKKVLISGFDISSQSANGVDCSNSDLTLTTSRIHRNTNGIVSAGCTLTVDRAQVFTNDNNGINLNSNTTYKLTNLQIWSNRSSGIVLTSGTGTMSFLTVYANGSPVLKQEPGISCGANINKIENSIVWRNISEKQFKQQVSGCMATNVVTDDSMATTYGGTEKAAVDFKEPSGADINLDLVVGTTANDDCCINKVQGTGLVDHDFKGSPRPKNGLYDIGADEAN